MLLSGRTESNGALHPATSPFRPESKSVGRLTAISLRPIHCGRSAHVQSVNFADRKTKNGTMFGDN
jgi:hypothetical protein